MLESGPTNVSSRSFHFTLLTNQESLGWMHKQNVLLYTMGYYLALKREEILACYLIDGLYAK